MAAGRAPDLPELPIQYRDFAAWQLERLQGPVLADLVAYWTNELRGAPQLLPLPTDRPRLPVQRHEGGRREVALPGELADSVRSLARAEGCTVYMVLLGAFSTLLYRLTGTDDVVVGSPIANRTTTELSTLVGFFCNTMALRTRLGGNPSFREVCGRVKKTALGAYEHQELPFERVVELLNVPRDPAYNPIFQVNFRAQDGPRLPLRLSGAETSLIPVDIGFSRFDLALELHVEQDRISGYFEFDRDLFDADTADRFADDLAALLEQVVADPDTPILAIRLPHGRRRAVDAISRIPTAQGADSRSGRLARTGERDGGSNGLQGFAAAGGSLGQRAGRADGLDPGCPLDRGGSRAVGARGRARARHRAPRDPADDLRPPRRHSRPVSGDPRLASCELGRSSISTARARTTAAPGSTPR